MAEDPRTTSELTDEELEAQEGEALPERETMMVFDPGPVPTGGLEPIPWSDGEPTDDRYEQ